MRVSGAVRTAISGGGGLPGNPPARAWGLGVGLGSCPVLGSFQGGCKRTFSSRGVEVSGLEQRLSGQLGEFPLIKRESSGTRDARTAQTETELALQLFECHPSGPGVRGC